MKLKYYLRGLGMGILFATIVMTVSSNIHKNNLSDEEIIEAAQKLGMVLEEDTEKKNGLWDKAEKETEDTEADTQNQPESQNPTDSQMPVDSQMPTDSQTPIDSQMPVDSQTPIDSQMPVDSQMPTDSQIPADSQTPAESQAPVYVKITIYAKDSATRVGQILYQNGLVDSAEDFRDYLKSKGYTTVVRAGVFEIPMGATYEEICEIIINMEWVENHL